VKLHRKKKKKKKEKKKKKKKKKEILWEKVGEGGLKRRRVSVKDKSRGSFEIKNIMSRSAGGGGNGKKGEVHG